MPIGGIKNAAYSQKDERICCERGRLIAEVPYDTDDSMDAGPYGAHASHLGSRERLRDLIEFAGS